MRVKHIFAYCFALIASSLLAQANTEMDIQNAPNMVLVRGGTFQMGDSLLIGSIFHITLTKDAEPVSIVTVSDFYMSKYEVTNAEFVKFLNAKGNQTEGGVTWIDLDGHWKDEKCRIYQGNGTFKVEKGYENHPVIYVSWYGATAYCKWLGAQYRLPTEAEWEYAAGNGSRHTKYSWGDNDPFGKKGGNVCDKTAKVKSSSWSAFESYTDGYIYTAPVGQFEANEFGLFDMSGNVWEWCSDWYDAEYYSKNASKTPKGPTRAIDYRVHRGGSFFSGPSSCRVAVHSGSLPNYRDFFVGFRVVRGY
jgi:sulfatase modifying factor 1